MITGAYDAGFAPRDFEPLHPQLWKGCVGAWAPCLGPSGVTLREWSGYRNHAALTNMDPNSDWVVSDRQWCLDFDGTNDFLNAPTPLPTVTSVPVLSACCWLKTTASNDKGICSKYYTTTNQRSWGMSLAPTTWTGPPTGGEFAVALSGDGTTASLKLFWSNGVQVNDGKWHHVGFAFVNGNVALFVDGKAVSTTAQQNNSFTSLFWSTVPFSAAAINILGTPAIVHACQLDDFRVYNRELSGQEFRILASRRGVSYDMLTPSLTYLLSLSGAARIRRILMGMP